MASPIQDYNCKYKCGICNKSYSKVTDLEIHVRMHTGERIYKCQYCDKLFTSKLNLQKHTLNTCTSKAHQGTHGEPKPETKPSKPVVRADVFVCFVCNMEHPSEEALMKHLETHDNVLFVDTESLGADSKLSLKVEDIQYFGSDSNLDTPAEGDHNYTAADSPGNGQENLGVHIEIDADKSEEYSTFSKMELQGFHIPEAEKGKDKTTKTDQVKVEDNTLCELPFPIENVIEVEPLRGEKISTGECSPPIISKAKPAKVRKRKKYACPYCAVSFDTSTFLKIHLEKLHSVSAAVPDDKLPGERIPENPVKKVKINDTGNNDDVEGENDNDNSDINDEQEENRNVETENEVHEITSDYANHRCDICGRNFAFERYLRKHVNSVHSNDRPFACHLCDKTFKENYIMKRHYASVHKEVNSNKLPYKCTVCGMRFSKKETWDNHYETTHKTEVIKAEAEEESDIPYKEGDLVCTPCNLKFVDVRHYGSHCRNVHGDNRPYECPECGKKLLSYGHLKRHWLVHTDERPHKCATCHKTFKERSTLKKHEVLHSDIQKLTCPFCFKRSYSKSAYLNHVASHKDEDTKFENPEINSSFQENSGNEIEDEYSLDENTENNTKQPEESKPSNLTFRCNMCPMKFSHGSKLNRHKLYRHSNKKPYTCDVCSKGFKEKYDLRKHKETHSKFDNDPIPCHKCDKVFYLKRDLMTHLRGTHHIKAEQKLPRPKNYVCDTCGKSFINITKLKRHEVSHSDERPFICQTCGKRFKDNESLHGHMVIHSENRIRYPCLQPGCEGRTFVTKTSLAIHMRGHTGERPYICGYCGVAFNQKVTLTQHERIHTGEKPLSCPFQGCGRRFANPASLRQHKLTHTDERPLGCEQCGKRFKDKGHLRTHQKTHLNIRPHICEYCNKAFTRRYHLKKHQETVHKTYLEVQEGETTEIVYALY